MNPVSGLTAAIDATDVELVIVRLQAGFSDKDAHKLAETLMEGFKGTRLEGVRLMFISDNFDLHFVRTKPA